MCVQTCFIIMPLGGSVCDISGTVVSTAGNAHTDHCTYKHTHSLGSWLVWPRVKTKFGDHILHNQRDQDAVSRCCGAMELESRMNSLKVPPSKPTRLSQKNIDFIERYRKPSQQAILCVDELRRA